MLQCLRDVKTKLGRLKQTGPIASAGDKVFQLVQIALGHLDIATVFEGKAFGIKYEVRMAAC
jgi:hypothetical protein